MNRFFIKCAAALALLTSLACTSAAMAVAVYQFEQQSDGAVLGYLTFNNPITTSSGWSTADENDIASFSFDNGFGIQMFPLTNPAILFDVSSSDGSEIDAGEYQTNYMGTSNWILTFANSPAVDVSTVVSSCGGCTYTGHWVASPVPVPGAILLFGSGLLGLAGFARRKKTP